MIKRMNKVTSLIVAAAAVASVIPATGVNAADYKKTETKDGTVYSAVAYKDGEFYIDGNVKDGQTDAAYYLKDGKYTEISNVDTGSSTALYADKYLNIDNGDYYLDLTTGKVSDEDMQGNTLDDLAISLRKAIKNVANDRFADHSKLLTASEISEINVGPKFENPWYVAQYTTSGAVTANEDIYTDAKGNYIDADYSVGKIKATIGNTTTAQSVTLTNTKDAEDYKNGQGSAKVSIADKQIIAQDAKNIYRIVTYTVEGTTQPITQINGVAVTGTAFTVDGNKVSFKAIQKISKAQASDDVGGAKYAASVTNYVLADKDGAKIDLLTDAKFSAFDGKLVQYVVSDTNKTVTAQTINFKITKGFNYIDLEDASEDKDETAFDVDANGNLWRLADGYLYKFDNVSDWTKVYKVDGAMQAISVYDDNSIVAWSTKSSDSDVYTIVGGKASTDTTDTTTTDTTTSEAVQAGWAKNADGTWSFNKEDKSKATGWIQDGSTWYFLNSNGIMQTGWVKDGSTWYFLNASGAMKTGWVNDNGTWYFLQSSGAMKTGWLKDTDGNWYYLQASGAMAANTTIDGYKVGANGAWVK